MRVVSQSLAMSSVDVWSLVHRTSSIDAYISVDLDGFVDLSSPATPLLEWDGESSQMFERVSKFLKTDQV